MSNLVEVVLSVGSNCMDRYYQVQAGTEWLAKNLEHTSVSSIYSTGDCHGGPRDYHNAVVRGSTTLDLHQLDRLCKKYESDHGRTQEARMRGDVPIDIDIVIYQNEILRPKDFNQKFFKIGYQEITKL